MLTYNSSLQNNPPIDPDYPAMDAVRKRSPFTAFRQNHQDVFSAMGARQATALELEAQKANTDYALQQQQAQRDLALAGLTNMSQAQQNQTNLDTARLQNMVGFANSLLGGLFS